MDAIFGAGETVTRLRAQLVQDPYNGEPTESWSQPLSEPFPDTAVAVAGSSDYSAVGRSAQDADYTVMLASNSDIRATDRLVVRGDVCQIEGIPAVWRDPFFGDEFGMIVNCKIRKG